MRVALVIAVAVTVFGCGTRSGLLLPDPTEQTSDGLCNDLAPSMRFCARDVGYREPYIATNGELGGGDYELTGLGEFANGTGSLGKVTSGELSGRMVVNAEAKTMSIVLVDGRGGEPRRMTYAFTTNGANVALTPKCGATRPLTGRYSRDKTFLTIFWENDGALVRETWGRPD